MSLSAAISQIYEQIRAISPTTCPSEGFVPWDEAGGSDQGLEAVVDGPQRLYDVVILTLPVDDGVAYVTQPRLRTEIAVRVSYARGTAHDRRYLQALMGEDVAAIMARVLNPNNWNAAVTEIDALIASEDDPETEILHDGARVLVTIPFTLIHY